MTAILVSSHQLDLSGFQHVPGSLQSIIQQVSEAHYPELYEEKTTSASTLTDALKSVLNRLGECSHDPRLSYGCLAMILGLAVCPTVRCYLPDEQFTRLFFQELFHDFFEPKKAQNFRDYYEASLGHYQALDEALLVLEECLQVRDDLQAPSKLLDISEMCLEGYAIFPGSVGRRQLFDWWLLEAIPAACIRIFPTHIHTMRGLRPRQESLEELRSYFWAVVRQGREKGWASNGAVENLLGFMAG
ncbi:MAG: hypothetical protein VKJ27_08385 [Synechocystis sp.]|nr:hypothetical protein [Synechocystis sp.]